MKKKTKTILSVLGVFVIGGLIFNSQCSTVDSDSKKTGDSGDDEKLQPVWVEVADAIIGDIVSYISETGVTSPFQSVVVSAEMAGRIVQIGMEMGDFVLEGDTIAYIDDELAQLSLDRAEAQLINATATYEKAKKDLMRYRILLDKEEISESEYEDVRVGHELARSAYLSMEASVKSARRQLRNTRITSPIDGQIAEKMVDSGNMISINQPVVKVVDIRKIKVNISVSEQDIGSIRKMMTAAIQVDAYPGIEFTGSVYAISPEANSESHTFPVEIIVPNSLQMNLKSGMVVRVTIQNEVHKNVTLIPRDAVIERVGETIVYIADGGKAQKRNVVLGLEKGNDVQIISGLSPGESVVTVGQYNLYDGSPVRIK